MEERNPDTRPIPGYPGYFITSDARIWSAHTYTLRELFPVPNRDGYFSIRLTVGNRRPCVPLHQLVLRAFVGPKPSPDHVCRHLNGNRADNRIENLAWGTQAENIQDAIRHGTLQQPKRKLTEAQVREIEARCRRGEKRTHLAAEFDVGRETVRDIGLHKTWRHLWAAA